LHMSTYSSCTLVENRIIIEDCRPECYEQKHA
jgi:hypothetical protein